MTRTLRALALGLLLLPSLSFADETGIGDACALSQDCVAQALQDFYSKVLPLPVTDTVTMTDLSINGGIASINILFGHTRSESIAKPSDEFDLKRKLQDYANNLSCGENQGLERLYLNTNGRILWKVYFADGEFFTNYFITQCE
ncbi:hypothetical protein IFT48_00400 [Pseudomonas fluorescens]|uniref:hypothetical protein n=1 Tax=Pseudomonas fluorescens TaxID=294 RepID=UPI00177CB8B9|nr:hypothetical protein [Pseudomonas fluorescens]MBD8088450.1 hypothetical protein [Pseudomonas fluorescens]MBD8615103.1 hypothetical protein [Pseudomonas putida]